MAPPLMVVVPAASVVTLARGSVPPTTSAKRVMNDVLAVSVQGPRVSPSIVPLKLMSPVASVKVVLPVRVRLPQFWVLPSVAIVPRTEAGPVTVRLRSGVVNPTPPKISTAPPVALIMRSKAPSILLLKVRVFVPVVNVRLLPIVIAPLNVVPALSVTLLSKVIGPAMVPERSMAEPGALKPPVAVKAFSETVPPAVSVTELVVDPVSVTVSVSFRKLFPPDLLKLMVPAAVLMSLPTPLVPTAPPPLRFSVVAVSRPVPVRAPLLVRVMVGLVIAPVRVKASAVRATLLPAPLATKSLPPTVRASSRVSAVLRETTETTAVAPAAVPLTVRPPSSVLVRKAEAPPVVARLRIGVAMLMSFPTPDAPTSPLPVRLS